jgi:hypothetical protein
LFPINRYQPIKEISHVMFIMLQTLSAFMIPCHNIKISFRFKILNFQNGMRKVFYNNCFQINDIESSVC